MKKRRFLAGITALLMSMSSMAFPVFAEDNVEEMSTQTETAVAASEENNADEPESEPDGPQEESEENINDVNDDVEWNYETLNNGTTFAYSEPSEFGLIQEKYYDEYGNEIMPDIIPDGPDEVIAYASSLPSSFDLRDYSDWLPAVRNQNPTGTCWAHAALASLESYALRKGLVTSSVDFAESQIAYFAFHSPQDTTDPLYGDFYDTNTEFNSGTRDEYDAGGNKRVAIRTLARGTGPWTETSDFSVQNKPQYSEYYRYLKSGLYITDTFDFAKTETEAIKNYIYNYGAVGVSYYDSVNDVGVCDRTTVSLSSDDANYQKYNGQVCYYNADGTSSNHAINIVGWDDNFPKEYFVNGGTPSSNGAWICRNSWGIFTSSARNGYFYISYEEPTLCDFYAIQSDSSSKIGSTVYQYDGMGFNSFYITKAANVFTSKSSDSLTKVAFNTSSASTSYTIKVYSGITDGAPESGSLLCTKSGKIDRVGYHVIDLGRQVYIPYDTKFSVVVELDKAGFNVDDYALSGQSYFYYNSSWLDHGETRGGNIGIKVFTAPTSDIITRPIVSAKAGNNSVTLSWNTISGATRYYIYSYDPSDKSYSYLSSTTSTSYTQTGLAAGQSCYYAVTAYANGVESGYSNYCYATPTSPLAAPINLSTKAGDGCAKISWGAVDGASGYYVYVYSSIDDYYSNNYLSRYTASGTELTIGSLTNGIKYYFAVSAYTSSKESAKSIYIYSIPYLTTPTDLIAAAGDRQITLSWTAVKNAQKYRVSYSDGTNTYFEEPTTNSCTITQLTNGKTYTFKVCAYVLSYSDYSAAVSAAPIASFSVTKTDGDGRVLFSWSAVNGASEYYIRRYASEADYASETCAVSSSTTSLSYGWSGLTNGSIYYFAVLAVDSTGNIIARTPCLTVTPKRIKVSNLKAEAGDGKAVLSWDAVSNATQYNIYKYDGSRYLFCGASETATYTESGLTNGTAYRFAVAAYVAGAETTYSNMVSVTPEPSMTLSYIQGDGCIKFSWSSVSGAGHYKVHMYESEAQFASGISSDYRYTSYLNFSWPELTNGTAYLFNVKAYDSDGYLIAGSPLIAAAPKQIKPTNLSAEAGDKQAVLSWNAVENATEYNIYKYDGSSYTKIGDSTTTKYTATGLTNGTAYTFAVSAVVADYETSRSDTVLVTPYAKISASVAAGDSSAKFTWSSLSGTSFYYVALFSQKSSYDNNNWYNSKNAGNAAEYSWLGLTNNTEYYFAVIAFDSSSNIIGRSPLMTVVPKSIAHSISSKVTPSNSGTVTLGKTSAYNGDRVTVIAVPASGYKFSRWTIEGAGAGISDTSSASATLTVGTEDVVVTAVFESKGTPLPAPSNVKAVGQNGGVMLSWNAVAGAESYYIYMEGSTQCWITGDTSAYISAENGVKYGFTVAAYDADTDLVSEKSAVVYATPEDPVSAFVERLYTTLLGRASDPKGKQNHINSLKSGKTASDVAKNFVMSAELKNKNLSNKEFVTRMYRTMLGRNPDAKGLARWTAALDNGCSYGYVLAGFSTSAEFTNICASYGVARGAYVSAENRDKNANLTAYVSRMYTKALGRKYDVNGLNNHTGRYIAKTKDAAGIAHDFIFSKELVNKNLSDEQFVDVLYQAMFNRNADAGGKKRWLDKMSAGMTREQVFRGFTASAEFKRLVDSFGI